MIVIFVLVWAGALWGMEQEIPVSAPKVKAFPSLVDIASRIVAQSIKRGSNTGPYKQAQNAPFEIRQLIAAQCMFPVDLQGKKVNSITPDNHYLLIGKETKTVRNNQMVEYWDIYRKYTVTEEEKNIGALFKKNNYQSFVYLHLALSPSGNVVAILADALRIEDLQQNKVIAEKKLPQPINGIRFLGEQHLLIEDCNNHTYPLSIANGLEQGAITTFKLLSVIHATAEYVTINDNMLLKHKSDGSIKEGVKYIPMFKFKDPCVTSTVYEPDMLLAFGGRESRQVNIVSLDTSKDIGIEIIPDIDLVQALSFANKGRWLLVAHEAGGMDSAITIWDWKKKEKLITSLIATTEILTVSATDSAIPYPCLIQDNQGCLWSYDTVAIKALLEQNNQPSQQIAANSNDNNATVSSSIEMDK